MFSFPPASRRLTAAALLAAGAALGTAPAHAAIVNDLAFVSGGPGVPDIIDPPGVETVDINATVVSGAAIPAQTTLEARSDFRVLQSFTGFTGYNATTNPNAINIVNYTVANPTLADIRFDFINATTSSNSGVALSSGTAGSNTSAGTAFRYDLGDSFRIDFGIYTGVTSSDTSFTPGTHVVDAVAFVLTSQRASAAVTVTYYNAAGAVIAVQTGTGFNEATNEGREVYFALDVPGTAIYTTGIARVDVVSSGGVGFRALDDFGFTTAIPIPEPGALVLAAVGAALMGFRRRAV